MKFIKWFISKIYIKLNQILNTFKNPYQREYINLLVKYSKFPRYKNINIKFLKYDFEVTDIISFLYQFKDIFLNEIYRFNTNSSNPIIYDCGANYGTSCIYFKILYPNCKIKAFEADPTIANILFKNIHNNNLKDIEIINKAVWIKNGEVTFNVEGADGGSILNNNSNNTIKIQSIRLKELIENEDVIDLLKLDVEGVETDILIDCEEVLKKIKYLFIEYHSLSNNSQNLDKMLKILSNCDFRYYIQSINLENTPFLNFSQKLKQTFDLQLNIFAINKKYI